MIIREIFSSIKHNKARTILILLLMSLTYFLALMTLTNSLTFYTQINDVKKMFKVDLDNTYKINFLFFENERTIGADLEELKVFVNSQNNASYASYDMTGYYIDELCEKPEFMELHKKLHPESNYNDYEADVICVDPEIFDAVKFDLTKDNFQKIEKDGEFYMPVYAGKKLRGMVEPGEILTLSNAGDKYILAGFFESEKWFHHGGDPITFPLDNIEYYFIMPFSENEKFEENWNWHNMQMEATGGQIFINCSKETIEQYETLAAEKGIKLNIKTVNEFIGEWTAMNEKMLSNLLFLAAVVLISSVISITSVLCVNILLKKREYGIRIAFGSTKQKIITSLCAEFLLLNLIAGAVGYALSYHVYNDNVIKTLREIDHRTLTVSSLPLLFVIMIFLIMLVIIIPAILLKRYDPAVLIKEDE